MPTFFLAVYNELDRDSLGERRENIAIESIPAYDYAGNYDREDLIPDFIQEETEVSYDEFGTDKVFNRKLYDSLDRVSSKIVEDPKERDLLDLVKEKLETEGEVNRNSWTHELIKPV